MTRRVALLGIAVTIIVLLWIGYWAAASAMVRKEVESQIAAAGARGAVLDCQVVSWGGFPFRFERDCLAPHFSFAGNSLAARRIAVILQAWNFNHAVALVDGPLQIEVPSEGAKLLLAHDRALASVRRLGDDRWQASLEVPQLDAGRFGTADRLLLHARLDKPETIDVAFDGSGLAVRGIAKPGPLRLDIARLAATLPSAALQRDWARFFARSGETIAVTEAELGKGPLTVTATGTIGIDKAGHVAGALLTKSNRLDLLMASLQTDFGMKADDVQSLGAMIGLLNGGRSDGGAEVNLIAKDGKLYWGPVKLADLPALF